MDIAIVILLALLLLVALRRGLHRGSMCSIEENAVYTGPIHNLQVDSLSVDIEVKKSKAEKWEIMLSGKVYEKDRHHFKLVHEKNGEALRIGVKEEKTWFGVGMRQDMKVSIHVPEEYISSIMVDTSSADIDLSGLKINHTKLRAQSGDVTLENTEHINLKIRTSSGAVLLKNVQSERTDIRANSGDITGHRMNFGTGFFKATSGTILLRSEKMQGDLKADTSSGDITIYYKEQPSACTLELRSNSGAVHSQWSGLFYAVKSRHELKAVKDGGGYDVSATTTSGDMLVK